MKKCFIVYRENGELHTEEIDTSRPIEFNAFIEYYTPDAIVQDEIKNIVKIYFE